MNSTDPRFGYCYGSENEPLIIRKQKLRGPEQQAVAVIPLPFISTTIRRRVAEFLKTLDP